MTIEQLREKTEAMQKALFNNAVNRDNKIFVECMKDSLIQLQGELIRGLEARVKIAKSDESAFREAFEEVGHGVCDSCDGPMFAEEGHATFGGEQEICEGCYESAIGNV